MTNPFEDDDALYVVLRNADGQQSIWPVFAAVPDGWQVVFGPDARHACLDHVERTWTDLAV